MSDFEMPPGDPADPMEAFLIAAEQRHDWVAVAVAERAIWGVVSAATMLLIDRAALQFERDSLPRVYLSVTMLTQEAARAAIAESTARADEPELEVSYTLEPDLEIDVDLSDLDTADSVVIHDRVPPRSRVLSMAERAALDDLEAGIGGG